MTQKEKIELAKWYFGSAMKDAEKYVEDHDKEDPDGKAYEYMLDFMKHQGVRLFKED